MYHKAKGVEMDLETAIYWYKKAAEAGSIKAADKLKQLNKNLN
jgi:TPR repeat protein